MSQRFVICSQQPPGGDGLAPLGMRRDIIAKLGTMNTSPAQAGEDILYGPGIRLEMGPDDDPVKQMLMTIVEEEIAWLVISRMAKAMNWRIVDVETGDDYSFDDEETGDD